MSTYEVYTNLPDGPAGLLTLTITADKFTLPPIAGGAGFVYFFSEDPELEQETAAVITESVIAAIVKTS